MMNYPKKVEGEHLDAKMVKAAESVLDVHGYEPKPTAVDSDAKAGKCDVGFSMKTGEHTRN